MRVAWITDIHLNFVSSHSARREFYRQILRKGPDIVLVGGDIAEADSVMAYLREMQAELCLPIYFVLGNHDFYGGAIGQVRQEISDLCTESDLLHWLNTAGIVRLTEKACLIGHDGWGDARFGDYERSTVVLNDEYLIHELKDGSSPNWWVSNKRDQITTHIEA